MSTSLVSDLISELLNGVMQQLKTSDDGEVFIEDKVSQNPTKPPHLEFTHIQIMN